MKNKIKGIIIVLLVTLTKSNIRKLQPGGQSSSTNSYDYSLTIIINTTTVINETISPIFEATEENTSVIYVSIEDPVTIDSVTLSKTSGDSSNITNSEFYGVNAALLVNGSNVTLTSTNVTTAAEGANAVFVTNSGIITINGGTITSTDSDYARGLYATYDGNITASDLTITTQGNSCATLATGRGEGTVTCLSCTLTTNGVGSPVIYSTGDITIIDTNGTANGAQMVVVEGKNFATVTSSNLTGVGVGNRNNVDKCGIMIYQSQSGDADNGVGSFIATNSKFTIPSSSSVYSSAPMFFITNTEATITLKNNTFTYGSGIFIDIKGTDEWGTSGSNGGDVTLTASGQTIEGDIVVDDYSSLTLILSNSSSFKGTINSARSSGTIKITIDSSSTLTLTRNSKLTSLTNSDSTGNNINTGSYSLTYFDYNFSPYLKMSLFGFLFVIIFI